MKKLFSILIIAIAFCNNAKAQVQYPFAPLYTAYNPITPTTQKADLENTTVIHGTGNLG
jgi:hypothetical protein